jgi:hypothetical protein
MDNADLRLSAILFIDNYSRINSQVDIAELKRFGADIVSDFKDVLDLEYDKKPIVLLEGFMRGQHALSDLVLHKKLLGLSYIFVGTDDVIIKQVERYAKVFVMDTKVVNYTLVSSVVNDDPEAKALFEISADDKIAKIAMVIAETNTYDTSVKEVAQAYLRTSEEYKALWIESESLVGQLEAARSLNDNKDEQIAVLSSNLDEILKQTVKVNESIRQYSFLCAKDVFHKVDLKPFKSKPNIIYFKEYTDFLFLNSFIYTLAESLKVQYSFPTKVLWLLDSKMPIRLRSVPEYYKLFETGLFDKPSIYDSDYLCSANGYELVIQTICENQTGLSFLIIVDSKLADDTVLNMSDVLRYDLCRDFSKIKKFGLSELRTIVNGLGDGDRVLSWDYLPEYADLSDDDRFLYFSGRPVIEEIVRIARSEFGL